MRIKSATLRLLLPILLLALLGAGCAELKRLPQEEGLHPRLTRFTYLERGELVAFAVDVEAALQRTDDPYIPLGVGVANRGLDSLVVNRESFTLIDAAGNRYPLATVREVRTELGATPVYDLRILEHFVRVFGGSYDTWPRRRSTFFPIQNAQAGPLWPGGRGIVIDRVELSKRSYFIDVLYFPRPEGELEGQELELWLDPEESDEEFFVKFEVK